MEYPHGHHSHTHHHHHHSRNDEDEERQDRPQQPYYPPPPPSFEQPPPSFEQPPPSQYYGQNEFAPPPPPRPSSYYQEDQYPPPPPRPTPYYQEPEYSPPPPPPTTHVTHMHHSGDQQDFSSFNYQPPPPSAAEVTHVAHEVGEDTSHHSFRPHLPSFFHHGSGHSGSDFHSKPSVKVYSKARPDFSLTVRDGKVILAPSDPSDQSQHWIKDEKFSTKVKDEEGCPCFSLVNKATGQAMKHSIGDTHPVQLKPYDSDHLDESILWTESKELGDGYRAIRMVNNVHLNVDAFHGDRNSGGVHEGTIIVLWKWNEGVNQRWKIVPYCKFLNMNSIS